jgi:hypothetical protein
MVGSSLATPGAINATRDWKTLPPIQESRFLRGDAEGYAGMGLRARNLEGCVPTLLGRRPTEAVSNREDRMDTKLAIAVTVLLVMMGTAEAQNKKLVLAGLPCSSLLGAHKTAQFDSYIQSIRQDIGDRDIGGRLGSNINITEYILTECRLNEGSTVGEAAEKLFADSRNRKLPPIPIGGATDDPKVQAD